MRAAAVAVESECAEGESEEEEVVEEGGKSGGEEVLGF